MNKQDKISEVLTGKIFSVRWSPTTNIAFRIKIHEAVFISRYGHWLNITMQIIATPFSSWGKTIIQTDESMIEEALRITINPFLIAYFNFECSVITCTKLLPPIYVDSYTEEI